MREKLIEMLNKSFEEQSAKRGILTAPHTADYLIANGVTIDPASLRPKGEWEINDLGYLVCPHCAWVRYGIPLVEHFNFCPNCGADMRGESDAR